MEYINDTEFQKLVEFIITMYENKYDMQDENIISNLCVKLFSKNFKKTYLFKKFEKKDYSINWILKLNVKENIYVYQIFSEDNLCKFADIFLVGSEVCETSVVQNFITIAVSNSIIFFKNVISYQGSDEYINKIKYFLNTENDGHILKDLFNLESEESESPIYEMEGLVRGHSLQAEIEDFDKKQREKELVPKKKTKRKIFSKKIKKILRKTMGLKREKSNSSKASSKSSSNGKKSGKK
uniref:Uncharacterized protein n=1 Tax=viral metagenome TaxID=1070528 RepID=A0A6C0HZ81_9ZZZZ